jgi:hypothetical protein
VTDKPLATIEETRYRRMTELLNLGEFLKMRTSSKSKTDNLAANCSAD